MVHSSPTFYFQAVGVLMSKMSLLETANGWVLLFFIQSETLRLLMGSLSPFTFRVTIERYEFSVIMIPIQSLLLWIIPWASSFFYRVPLNISCRAGLVVTYSFSFCLSWKLFISPSILNQSLA